MSVHESTGGVYYKGLDLNGKRVWRLVEEEVPRGRVTYGTVKRSWGRSLDSW